MKQDRPGSYPELPVDLKKKDSQQFCRDLALRGVEEMFEALQHLKYNKHEVILFHTYDKEKEIEFNFNNRPKRFVDLETGEHLNLYADNVRQDYKEAVQKYFNELKIKCGQYRIKYVPVNINEDFSAILTSYLVERQKFK